MLGRTHLRLATLALAFVVGVVGWTVPGPASAQCPVPSMATGNIDDLITYAGCVKGCGLDVTTPPGDVCKTNALIIPCAATSPCSGGGLYFVNGFDMTHATLAYDAVSKDLFLGYRVVGLIGDTDGNGNPDNAGGPGCTIGANVTDQPGIGTQESYVWTIDTNCDGTGPKIQVSVNGALPNPTVSILNFQSGNPLAGASGTATVTGSDLKVKITGISDPVTGKAGLPAGFFWTGQIGSAPDGLSEDSFAPQQCVPTLNLAIEKTANPARLCPDATTSVTLTIHNNSNTDLTSVTVTDDLPLGISYVAGSTGSTCSVGEPTIAAQNLTWNVGTLVVNQTCTITFTARRVGTACFGTVTNHSSVVGFLQAGCLNNNLPTQVGPVSANFDLVCVDAPRVTLGLICQPDHQCAGGAVSLNWTATNTSQSDETITLVIDGQPINLGVVAAGATQTGTKNAVMPAICPASGTVPFSGTADATNECPGGPDSHATASCDVACISPPLVTLDLVCQPDHQCAGGAVNLNWTATNTSQSDENITLVIDGQPIDLGLVTAGTSRTGTKNAVMPATCPASGSVTFSGTADASNQCPGGPGAHDDASCDVACISAPLVTLDLVCQPDHQCAGGAVSLNWTATNTSQSDENITLVIDGQPIDLGLVTAGASRTGTKNAVMPSTCPASGSVTFSGTADASNQCPGGPGAHDDASCDVTCISAPLVTLDLVCQPDHQCAGGAVSLNWTATNTSQSDENITLVIDGQPIDLGLVTAGASRTGTKNAVMPTTCPASGTVTFSGTADATNECPGGPGAHDVASCDVTCIPPPKVSCAATPNPTKACEGTSIVVTGSATNTSDGVEDILLTIAGTNYGFLGVPVGATVSRDTTVTMPNCTDGQFVEFPVSAVASNSTCPGSVTCNTVARVECQTPVIQVGLVASPVEGTPVNQTDNIHYTITVTNPSTDVTLENLVVTDVFQEAYADNANPAAFSEPAVGTIGGTVVWHLASLAPLGTATFQFDVTVENRNPCVERNVVNRVTATGSCGADNASATDQTTHPVTCPPVESLCRITGGGCLNEKGGRAGHKQNTFGGNASPEHTGGGPTGNEWEHVLRDGREILFNFHSHDAHVIDCSVVPPGPCSPHAVNTRADFEGTGTYSLGAGSRTESANFSAYIIDHKEGSCNKNTRDFYSIVVRKGLVQGAGDVVFSVEGEIDCGNLQIHETPASIFGAATTGEPEPAALSSQPSQPSELTDVALLNRVIPNPFTNTMSYSYSVSGGGQSVNIGVYDMAGRLVRTLSSGWQSQGQYTVRWDSRSNDGAQMAPGVYFLRARIDDASNVSRVVLLRR